MYLCYLEKKKRKTFCYEATTTTTKNYIMSLENFHFILDAESIHTYFYIHGFMEEMGEKATTTTTRTKKPPEAICA